MKHRMRRVAAFTDKYPLIGPLVYALSIQYFAVQLIAAAAWSNGYSWRFNVISDLGNTVCGQYGDRFVCSPDHALMNASFIMLGITMALGSLFIYHEFRRTRASLIGFSLMAISGLGTLLVGFFPENTVHPLHALGAFLTFALGGLGMVFLAFALRRVRASFRIYTLVSGVLALTAFVLFVCNIYLGLGQGGMERLVSYPQTIWLTLLGLYMCATRLRATITTKVKS